jgi:hypothetical protein
MHIRCIVSNMHPELINQHRERRGCKDWFEYARVFRIIHVEARRVGIGILFDAYMPAGHVVTTADFDMLLALLPIGDCRSMEIVSE